jgi:hypothetical protein
MIRAERVREKPETDAPGERNLLEGTPVRVVDVTGEWAVVARDGVKLGYVPLIALLQLRQ